MGLLKGATETLHQCILCLGKVRGQRVDGMGNAELPQGSLPAQGMGACSSLSIYIEHRCHVVPQDRNTPVPEP